MKLPNSKFLPIEKLEAVFRDTVTSYKYYWFIALLENLKVNSNDMILTEDIVIEMIGEVWYPVNYFKLSFGKQDQFVNAIKEINDTFGYPKDIKKQDLIQSLKEMKYEPLLQKLKNDLSRYVPYRFLSPWYTPELRGITDAQKNNLIMRLSEQRFFDPDNQSIYRFTDDQALEINPDWKLYLLEHINILQGFTYWHLTNYIQKNNPNIPNIPDKLFPPEKRNLANARKFWDNYFITKNKVICIYTEEVISKKEYSIDHFLPWSFVAHDQLWNLAPAPKNINSSKGDNLPSDKYLERFISLQYDAFRSAILSNVINKKILEDYSILFKDGISNIAQLNKDQFGSVLLNNIKPMMQIATNMGFKPNWIFK